MSPEPLGAQTLVLVERTRVKHGQFVDGPSSEWPGCSVQGQGSTEGDQGLTTEASWLVFIPGGTFPVDTKNMVRWQGHELQVDGKLQVHYDDLTGEALHTSGKLKEWQA